MSNTTAVAAPMISQMPHRTFPCPTKLRQALTRPLNFLAMIPSTALIFPRHTSQRLHLSLLGVALHPITHLDVLPYLFTAAETIILANQSLVQLHTLLPVTLTTGDLIPVGNPRTPQANPFPFHTPNQMWNFSTHSHTLQLPHSALTLPSSLTHRLLHLQTPRPLPRQRLPLPLRLSHPQQALPPLVEA
jgi:hypothetical protein